MFLFEVLQYVPIFSSQVHFPKIFPKIRIQTNLKVLSWNIYPFILKTLPWVISIAVAIGKNIEGITCYWGSWVSNEPVLIWQGARTKELKHMIYSPDIMKMCGQSESDAWCQADSRADLHASLQVTSLLIAFQIHSSFSEPSLTFSRTELVAV